MPVYLLNLFYTITIIFFTPCSAIHLDIPTFTIDKIECKALIGDKEHRPTIKAEESLVL